MLRRLLLLACGLSCFAPSAAFAQDTPLWRTVGAWQIRVDASLGFGCFLLGSYTRGTVLRIGINQQNGNGYVMVGDESWRSLQVGNQYDLSIRFDNNSPWRGRATARRIGNGDMVFLYLSFDRARFLVELARRNNMTIFYQGRIVTQLPLHGTNAAVQEMLNCQRAADAVRKNRPQGAIRLAVRRRRRVPGRVQVQVAQVQAARLVRVLVDRHRVRGLLGSSARWPNFQSRRAGIWSRSWRRPKYKPRSRRSVAGPWWSKSRSWWSRSQWSDLQSRRSIDGSKWSGAQSRRRRSGVPSHAEPVAGQL